MADRVMTWRDSPDLDAIYDADRVESDPSYMRVTLGDTWPLEVRDLGESESEDVFIGDLVADKSDEWWAVGGFA